PLLGGERPRRPTAGVDLRLPHPAPQRRLRQIQFPRDDAYGLTALPDNPNGLCLELRRECSPLAFGHDTLLPHFRAIRGVHQIGAGSSGLCASARSTAVLTAAPCPHTSTSTMWSSTRKAARTSIGSIGRALPF